MPLIAATISGTTLDLNTGAPGSAWLVQQTTGVSNNGAALNTNTAAVVLTGTLPFAANLPGFEAFAWANPFGGAVWVGQLGTDGQFTNGGTITCTAPCGATAGDYVYTYSFNAFGGGALSLTGFTGDNGVRSLSVVSSSSGTLYSCSAGGPGTLCASTQATVTASTGSLAFGEGTVTITALVQNLDGPGRNPTGFILSGSAIIGPEPSSYTMLGLGGLALVLAKIRKWR